MFGRHPRLALNDILILPTDSNSGQTSEYVRKLRDRLNSAYKVARYSSGKSLSTNKAIYGQRAKDANRFHGDCF